MGLSRTLAEVRNSGGSEHMRNAYAISHWVGQRVTALELAGTPYVLPGQRAAIAPLRGRTFSTLEDTQKLCIISAMEGQTSVELAAQEHAGASAVRDWRKATCQHFRGLAFSAVIRHLLETKQVPLTMEPNAELVGELPFAGLLYYDLHTRGMTSGQVIGLYGNSKLEAQSRHLNRLLTDAGYPTRSVYQGLTTLFRIGGFKPLAYGSLLGSLDELGPARAAEVRGIPHVR